MFSLLTNVFWFSEKHFALMRKHSLPCGEADLVCFLYELPHPSNYPLENYSFPQVIFSFLLDIFYYPIDSFYYKLCNIYYKLANTYYKLCNKRYKLCNKLFLRR